MLPLKFFFRECKQGKKVGYPSFKSKHNHNQSYRSKYSNGNIKAIFGFIQLPNLGLVCCAVSRPVKSRIISATVRQVPSGKYFVSICCTDAKFEEAEQTGAIVWINLGIKDFVITSDVQKFRVINISQNLKRS